jgi:hypothetical protein
METWIMDDLFEGKEIPPGLKALLEKAQAGDASQLPELRAALREFPKLTAKLGDSVQHAEQALLQRMSGKSVLAREAVSIEHERLRERLRADTKTELEKLLVDRVCLCKLELDMATHEHIDRLNASKDGTSPLVVAARKRLESAHARFVGAVKALATVQQKRPGRSIMDILNPDLGGTKAVVTGQPKNRVASLVGAS